MLSHDGASDLYHALIKEADAARAQWQQLTSYFPSEREHSRRLIMMHPKGGKSHPVDELLLHAHVGLVEGDAP